MLVGRLSMLWLSMVRLSLIVLLGLFGLNKSMLHPLEHLENVCGELVLTASTVSVYIAFYMYNSSCIQHLAFLYARIDVI